MHHLWSYSYGCCVIVNNMATGSGSHFDNFRSQCISELYINISMSSPPSLAYAIATDSSQTGGRTRHIPELFLDLGVAARTKGVCKPIKLSNR